jgi:uncharacterized protein (TIGR00369 family)
MTTIPEDILRAFHSVPLNKHLQLKLIAQSPQSASVRLQPAPELLQEEGVVHGAIITAIADTAGIYPFFPDLPSDTRMTSIEFKLNFLSPALLDRGPIIATSKVVRKGRAVGVCDVEVFQQETMIAKGLFTYLFYPRK